MKASETLDRLNARVTAARGELAEATAERRRLGLENLKGSDSKRGARVGTLTARIRELENEIADLDANRAELLRQVAAERAAERISEFRDRAAVVDELLKERHALCAQLDFAIDFLAAVCPAVDDLTKRIAYLGGKNVRPEVLMFSQMRDMADLLWERFSALGLLPQLAHNGSALRSMPLQSVSIQTGQQIRARIAADEPTQNEEAA